MRDNSPSSCIYTAPKGMCSGGAALDDEHYLSRGLGNFRGYELLREKICRDCNGRFGRELEDIFLHVGPVAALREMARLEGRKGHRKKPIFHEPTRGYGPIQLIGSGPEGESEILWEPVKGTDGRPLRQIVFRDRNGKILPIALPKRVQSKDGLIDLLASEKASDLKPVEIYPDPDDPDGFEKMASLCAEVFGLRATNRTISGGSQVNARYDFPPPPEYRRAIAKIGFHFFLTAFPELSGLESEFNEIKRLIYLGGDPTRFVTEKTQVLPAQLSPVTTWIHLLCADWEQDYLRARVQLFAGFRLPASKRGIKLKVITGDGREILTDTVAAPLIWVVHLAKNRSRQCLGTRSQAFVAYGSRRGGYDGEVRNLTV